MQSGFYRKFIPEKKDTLTIGVFSDSYWEVQNGYSYQIVNDAIDLFQDRHPDIRVDYVSGILKSDYSEWLAEQVVMLAGEQLRPHGNMVIKIFQGGGEQEVLKTMRQMFSKAKAFKPKASREDSFEIFLIGLDKKDQNGR